MPAIAVWVEHMCIGAGCRRYRLAKYEIVEAGLGLGIAPVTIFILHYQMDSAP